MKNRRKSLYRKNAHNWSVVSVESGTALGLLPKSDYSVIIRVNPVVNEIANDMRAVGQDICKAYEKLRGQPVATDYRKVISKDGKSGQAASRASSASKCVAEENFDRYASIYRATKAY